MSTDQPASGPQRASDDVAAPVESDAPASAGAHATETDVSTSNSEDDAAEVAATDASRVDSNDVEVDELIDPSTVRRAPKYKAFFWTGALAGIVFGLVLGGILLSGPGAGGLMKPGVYLTVTVLGTTTFTVLLAGFLAIVADRWSLRSRKG